MAQYLLSVWHDDTYDLDFEPPDVQRRVAQVEELNTQMQSAGAWVFAGGLHPASAATVFRLDDGDVSTSDGPYAGSGVQMGGFWVIEAPDTDAARDWARRAAIACEDPVEIRPFQGE